jgi:signal transduction histidine kinase
MAGHCCQRFGVQAISSMTARVIDKVFLLHETLLFRYALFCVASIVIISTALLSFYHTLSFYKKMQSVDNTLNSYTSYVQYIQYPFDLESLIQTRGIKNLKYYVYTSEGVLNGNIYKIPKNRINLGLRGFYTVMDSDEKVIYYYTYKKSLSNEFFLSIPVTDIVDDYRNKFVGLFQSIVLFLIFGVISGFFISYDFMRRLHVINQSIQLIMMGDLSKRVKSNIGDRELEILAENANLMLDTIQDLITGIRQVSNNIAHDLRTPLTRMRNQLVELSAIQENEKNKESVTKLISEADNLLSTFNALLRIANIEANNTQANFKKINLVDILNDVLEFYEPLAQEKKITLNTTNINQIEVFGDKDLLFQMCVNLIDNAIKYSYSGSEISISTMQIGRYRVLEIADRGIGISKEDRDKVFRRFYRVEASRGLKPGNGLGLSLVMAIVSQHNASIKLHDNNPGLLVEVIFNGTKPEQQIKSL